VIRFLAIRLLWYAITIWAVFTVSWLLMRSVPGGPYASERKVSEDVERNLMERYRLDRPMHVQYWNELTRDVTLDFGYSMKMEDYTVGEIIAEGLPISASLGVVALALALFVGLSVGVISALWRQSLLDVSLRTLATLGIAIPNFVLAGAMIVLFVFELDWFPAAGWGSPRHLFLPAVCLAAPFAAYIARLTRTGMLDTLHQDYIRTAVAKGLTSRQVVLKHALRGALLPVVSFLGPAIAGILTGSLVLERIFVIPGMGTHFVEAALQRDYPLAMGVVLVYTTLVFAMNTLVDLSYALIDPRVKLR